MSQYLKICTFILFNSLFFSELFTQQPQPFSITINCAQPPITLNNIMDSQPQTTVAPIQTTKQSNTQELQQETLINKVVNPFNQIHPLTQEVLQYCWGKKYHILIGIIFCSIASFFCYYYQMKAYLNDEKNWFTWHDGSLENLLESNNQSVIENLLKEIQIRYYSWENPTDPIHALVQFSIAINKEIIILKQYIFVLYWAKKIYLHYLLSIEHDRQEAEKKLKFIIFLQKQFLEWISQHNIKALDFNKIGIN